MKHAPNGREESKNSQGWGPENPLTNSQGRDPRIREQRRAVPIAGKHKEFTKQLSVTAETQQRDEWVQVFQKMFH